MGFCNYILGKENIFILFFGISKEYPIIAQIGKLTNKIMVNSIIINGTSKGRLEILLNIDESLSK